MNRSVNKVFLHCSASDNPAHDNAATIKEWHLARGFNDIGYHYFIRKDGTLEEGRSLDRIPAAQMGHNRGTIAICLHGLESFTEAQYETLRKKCAEINEEQKGRISFHGHCEVSNKACPVFPYKEVLNLDRWQRMA